jgi:hypothetical protein
MNPAFLNVCSEYRDKVCKPIFEILASGKGLRARLDGLGITLPAAAGGGPGPALPGIQFPLPGDLSHITSANQLLALIAGLEALEDAMGTASTFAGVGGQQTGFPVAAFAQFRG